jgi:hypothetical protein
MPLIPPAALATMRTQFARVFLSDTCAISREDGTPAGTVACRIKDPTASNQAIAVQMERLSANVKLIRLPVGTDVRRGDRITESGITYEVVTLTQNRTDEVLIDVVGVEIR